MITSRVGIIPTLRRTVFAPRLSRFQANLLVKRRLGDKPQCATPRAKYWTLTDLKSYNIHLHEQDAATFFQVQELPEPIVDSELWNNAEVPYLLELATASTIDEPIVIDFARMLFRAVGYHDAGRLALTRREFGFRVCGRHRRAKTDICIVDYAHNRKILLVVREDKRVEGGDLPNAQARIVAAAVAAFTENNRRRVAAGLDPLLESIMPGIVMAGTSPTFFKIPVNMALLNDIRRGMRPRDVTTVTFCQPPVSRPERRWHEGMVPLDNRRQILGCYQAFKMVMGI